MKSSNYSQVLMLFSIKKVPISKNSHADSLAILATVSREDLPQIILVESYVSPTYNESLLVEINSMRVGPS